MDLETLLAQAQSKMQTATVCIDTFVDAIEDHNKCVNESLEVLSEATHEVQKALDNTHLILRQFSDSIGQLGETVTFRVDQLDQKISEFRDKALSIQSEFDATLGGYAELVRSTNDSMLDASTDLLGKLTEYDGIASALEGEFTEAESQFSNLKEEVSSTISMARDTASADLNSGVNVMTSFKDLCVSKAEEVVEQLQSMTENAEIKGEELLKILQASNSDKLATLESLFAVDIVSSLTDATGIFADAATTLQSLGVQDIERYTANIDDILEYSDKLTNIYEDIKPIIELIA